MRIPRETGREKRPDRACIVYSRKCKELYPDTPVILGGLEASLRRFAHYDYWDDRVRPSILLEAKADLLTFGMGENQTRQIASKLGQGLPVSSLRDIRGVCYAVKTQDYQPGPAVECPSFERVCSSKRDYAVSCRKQQDEHDAVRGKTVIQRHGDQIVVQNPPMPPLTTQELDRVYALPYERMYHPPMKRRAASRESKRWSFPLRTIGAALGPAIFCSIAYHQGRAVTVRSQESILAEAKRLTENPRFKGYIHDVGRTYRKFQKALLRKAENSRAVQREKMSGPETVSSASGGSQRIFGDPAKTEKAAEGQAGIYPIRHPVRLPNPGQRPGVFPGTGPASCQRPAEGGAGALLGGGAGCHGKAAY